MKDNLTTNVSDEAQSPAFLVGAVIRRRHKWKRTGHLLNHEWTCVNCGCVKDANRLYSTEYRLNGVTYESAPNCPGACL